MASFGEDSVSSNTLQGQQMALAESLDLPPNTADPTSILDGNVPNVLADAKLGLHRQQHESAFGPRTPSVIHEDPMLEGNNSALETDNLVHPSGGDDCGDDNASVLSRLRAAWNTPSPLWLYPAIFMIALCLGIILAPKMEIYTRLLCSIMPEKSQPDDTPETTLMYDYGGPILSWKHEYVTGIQDENWAKRCRTRKDVQQQVTFVASSVTLLTGVLSTLTIGFWGALSDVRGRKLVIVLGIVGMIVAEATFLMALKYHKTLGYQFLFIGPVVSGFLGSFAAIATSLNAYVADCTDPGSRAPIFAALEGFMFAGIAFGPTVGSLIYKLPHATIFTPFIIAIFIHLILIGYVAFIMPESLSSAQKIKARQSLEQERINKRANESLIAKRLRRVGLGWTTRFLDLFKSISTVLPQDVKKIAEDDKPILWKTEVGMKGERQRRWVLPRLAVAFATYSITIAMASFKIQYVVFKYGWGPGLTGFFLTFMGATKMVTLIAVLPLVAKMFKPKAREPEWECPSEPDVSKDSTQLFDHKTKEIKRWDDEKERLLVLSDSKYDLNLAKFSTLATIIPFAILSLPDPSPPTLLVAIGVSAFGSAAVPAVQSLSLAHVSKRNTGKLFASLSAVQALCAQVLGPLVYGALFFQGLAIGYPELIFAGTVVALLIGFTMLVTLDLDDPVEEYQIVLPADVEAATSTPTPRRSRKLKTRGRSETRRPGTLASVILHNNGIHDCK